MLSIPAIGWANCDGPYKDKELNRAQLLTIIKQEPSANLCKALLDNVNLSGINLHGANLAKASLTNAKLNETDLSDANLEGADLSNACLYKTYLRTANLKAANLNQALIKQAVFLNAQLQKSNFSQAHIVESDFRNAHLEASNFKLVQGKQLDFLNAHMQHANFEGVILHEASFKAADMAHAKFKEAQLIGANFNQANLTQADFNGTNLKEALFKNSTLTGTRFQNANLFKIEYWPSLMGTPDLTLLATSQHLDTIHFYNDKLGAPAIVALRAAYKKAGFKQMERLLTSMHKEAIMWAQMERGGFSQIKGLFSYLLFYITCDFGLSPTKPLLILFVLMLLFSIPYYLSFGARSPHSGITVTWPSRKDPIYMLEASYQHFVKIHSDDPWIVRNIKRYRRAMTAIYFSLLSSLRLGWEDFNLAAWITKIQTREYYFSPKGWVRSLAGLQAIVCAYLIVLWALTYFGTPFDW